MTEDFDKSSSEPSYIDDLVAKSLKKRNSLEQLLESMLQAKVDRNGRVSLNLLYYIHGHFWRLLFGGQAISFPIFQTLVSLSIDLTDCVLKKLSNLGLS